MKATLLILFSCSLLSIPHQVTANECLEDGMYVCAELTSSRNEDPACAASKVTFTCAIQGRSLQWLYDDIILKTYIGGDTCGTYESVPSDPTILPEGVEIRALLASNITGSGIANCTSILEVTSNTTVNANIQCIATNTDDTCNATASKIFTILDTPSQPNISLEMIARNSSSMHVIYNFTWTPNNAVDNVENYEMMIYRENATELLIFHPNESFALVALEQGNDYQVEFVVCDKCGQDSNMTMQLQVSSGTKSATTMGIVLFYLTVHSLFF